jgi:hypothetical protein
VELGRYAVPLALIAYAAFGTSRQLVVGPLSSVSVMSESLVAALRPANAAQAVLFTTAAAVWGEIVPIVAAQLRIGWVAAFLSKPIVTWAAATLCRCRSSWARLAPPDHAGSRQRCGSLCLRDRTTPRIRQPGSSRSTDPESAETPGDHERHREYRGAHGASRRMDELQMGLPLTASDE